MRHIFLCGLLLILWTHVYCFSLQTLRKRNICSNNECYSCDGTSCNICNNNDCCSSVSCNQCVNECSNRCNSVTCKQNCVSGCTNTCSSNSCPVQSCSQCVNTCSNQCSSNECTRDCSNRCDCEKTPIIVEPPQPPNVFVNNTNTNLVNLTTHINFNNVVHNFNNISVPVYVNTTNINNIQVTNEGSSSNGTVLPPQFIPIPIPYPVPGERGSCCYIYHPKTCYSTDEGIDRCYTRRHRECSPSCTSPVVTIEEDRNRPTGCQFIRNYPYVYCGNYVRRDCGQCLVCGGSYNPSECSKQEECSDTCKRSVSNCVPSQLGLQCS